MPTKTKEITSAFGGLRPTPRDRRDFSATRTFGAPALELPKRFDVEAEKGDISGPRTQEHNFCTAYAVSELGSDEHGIPMDAHFQAAMIGLLAGRPILEGADMRVAVRSGKTFGFLPIAKCPLHDADVTREVLADSSRYPNLADLMQQAQEYAMPAFFKLDGPYDHFDNFRSHLYAQQPDNGIALGIPWYASFNSTPSSGLIPPPTRFVGWHAITVKGFRTVKGEEVIRVRSWSGKRFGAKSYGYFTRERFNQVMREWGSIGFMYKDVPDDLIAALKERRLDLQGVVLDLLSKILIGLRHGVWK